MGEQRRRISFPAFMVFAFGTIFVVMVVRRCAG
jgi:hypothetical protein